MVLQKLKHSRANRLQTPADFKAVFNQPLRSRSQYFTVLAHPTQHSTARLGVIVAKRIIRKAVHRHRIRRLIRESFRLNQTVLLGLDVVVLVRCVIPKQPSHLFFNCLERQWKELVIEWQKSS